MHRTWRPKAFMSRDEFLAMQWIRENIPNDAIIASDRKDKEGWSGNYIASVWFGYSAYSGKQFYNEGEDYNLYAVSKVSKKRQQQVKDIIGAKHPWRAISSWKEISADYLIISNRITPRISQGATAYSTTVFENKDIIILENPHKAR